MRALRLNMWAVLASAALLFGACTADDSAPTMTATNLGGTTVITPTTPHSPPSLVSSSTTRAPAGTPLTQQQAYQVIFAFDPVAGDPAVLETALAVTGPRPAFRLPHFIEVGSTEVRDVVFAALAAPSGWSIPMLVAMREYGMPSGTLVAPKLWPSEVRLEIADVLRQSSDALYGIKAEMMIELNRRFVANELELCLREACEWGADWYSVPSAVVNPDGEIRDAMVFEGTVTVTSDTGVGDVHPITVRRLEGWVPVDGFLAEPPAFGLDQRTSISFDGAIVTEPVVNLFGWAEPQTTIRVGDKSTFVEHDSWELSVAASENGVIEIVGEAPGGQAHAEKYHYRYLPNAHRTFGYISNADVVDGQVSLTVDVAEFFDGEAATVAARADGVIGPDDEIENDFYVRNRNLATTVIGVDAYASVRLIDVTFGDLEEAGVPLSEFVRILEAGDDRSWYGAADEFTPYWFVVGSDDVIYQIQQQYLP